MPLRELADPAVFRNSNATWYILKSSSNYSTAYVVDVMFNSYHIFNTRKGQGSDVTTLFAPPSSFGPGGADPAKSCVWRCRSSAA